MSLDTAKTVAIVVVVALVALAIVSAWLMKTIAQKVALAVILVLLAAVVWTQRSALDECADKVRAATGGVDTTCSFFGSDIDVPTSRTS